MLVIELGLLSKIILLAKVTPKIGHEKYFLLILCWLLFLGCKKLKTWKEKKYQIAFMKKNCC